LSCTGPSTGRWRVRACERWHTARMRISSRSCGTRTSGTLGVAFEVIASVAPRLYPEIVPRVERELAPGRTLLVGAGIAFGARIAAEAFGVPL